MKVFISTDMEGATGIVHPEQISIKGDDYNRGRELLTGDVNAAVAGAVEAGAKEVVICEGHANMRVILIEKLNEKVRLVAGPASSKVLCQVEGIDDTFDAAFFVAYHAAAGTRKAVMPHTWVGRLIHKVKINNIEVGEVGINAAILAHYGVPVVLVTGDNTLCAEAKRTLSNVEAVAVKRAIGVSAAECLPPSATSKMIKAAAIKSLKNLKLYKPYKVKKPISFEISFHQFSMAEKAVKWGEVERVGEREIRIRGNNLLKIIKDTWQMLEYVTSEPADWMR